VTVTSPSGTPTGTVVVAPTSPTGLPPSYSCTATLVNGSGSCQVTPGAGTFGDVFYQATYSGDATHAASVSTGTHELIVPETTTTSVSPATAAAGSVTLTATVIGQAMTNISPSAGGTGTVTFTVTQGSVTVATCSAAALTYNGAGANLATCTATLAAGSYTVTAVYSGDPNNLTSTGTETLTVS
jgi:large repetitive protein